MSDRSSVASRILGACATPLGLGDSLENVNTFTLDDGALCYVTSSHVHFELHRDSTAVPNGTTIIAPIAGPGRWVEATGGTGVQGAQGFQGSQGATGVGSQGAQGSQGSQGNQGSALALPSVTAADNGDNLQVVAGVWAKGLNASQVVQSIANRNALAGILSEGMLVYVKDTESIYQLAADGTTWNFYDANPALAGQATWWVDPSGNDNNDGKTSGTALLTPFELSSRLCPRGKVCNLTTSVTVNINTVTLGVVAYNQLSLNITGDNTGAFATRVLTIVHGIASSSPITLSGVVTPVGSSATRGQLTTLSGTFVAGERIRFTSGAAIGAVCYSAGLNANAQNTFNYPLSIPTIAGASAAEGGPNLIPVPGDTCVVDTILVSYTQLNITCNGSARVIVFDCKATRVAVSGSNCSSIFAGTGGPVFLSGCVQTSANGRWENTSNGAFLLACRTLPTSKTSVIGNGWCLVQHIVQGTLGLSGSSTSYGLWIDGGRVALGFENDFNHPGQGAPSILRVAAAFTNGATCGGIEAENGTGGTSIYLNAAIVVSAHSEFFVDDFNTYIWGASASFGFGFNVEGNAYITQGNVSTGVFLAIYKLPSLVNFVVANLFFSYSDNPIVLPNANAGVIAKSYNIANNVSQTDNGFYLTVQSGNQGPTTFTSLVKAGLYQVSGYVATTTVDAAATGNPTLNIIFTDDSGVPRTVPVAVDPSLTALGGGGGLVMIENSSGGAISWSVTGITNAATSKYSARLRIAQISSGA